VNFVLNRSPLLITKTITICAETKPINARSAKAGSSSSTGPVMLQVGPVVQINSARRTPKTQSKKKNWRDFKGRELGKLK